MKKVLLKFTIQTTIPFGERETLGRILDRILLVPELTPLKFGFSEPLKLNWSPNYMKDLEPLYRTRGETCFFRLRKPMRGFFSVNTSRHPRSNYNEIELVIDYDGARTKLEELETLLKDLAVIVHADFAAATLAGGDPFRTDVQNPEENIGELGGVRIHPADPTGIRFLNRIWWINIFGRNYLDFFGEQAIEKIPAYRAEYIQSGLFWLQPSKSPLEMWTPQGIALAESIKHSLGRPKAFYGHDPVKPGIMLNYETPAFDFTHLRTTPQP